MHPLPPAITTKEAMNLLRVKTPEAFNAIRKRYGIKPVWRGGEGNVYLSTDFQAILSPLDNDMDPFYDHIHG